MGAAHLEEVELHHSRCDQKLPPAELQVWQ
jgi:hypothetical protein